MGPPSYYWTLCQCPGDHPDWHRTRSTVSRWKTCTVSHAYILNIILLMQAFTLRHTSKNVCIMEDYQKILDSVKGLEEQIKWILENDPSAIDHLASMVSPRPCLCSLAHHHRSWIS